MKIEKLNKDNIKEFIRDMRLNDAEDLELSVNKSELYGIKIDDNFHLGFNTLTAIDTIAIMYCSSKLSNELFYECIDFLNKSLVVENHLIIEVYDDKIMKLFDDEYKCRDICVSYSSDGNVIKSENIHGNHASMKEKFAEIDMKSIKYYAFKDMIFCNLVKQNIQNEANIEALHNEFVNQNVKYVNFIIYPDILDYFKSLKYTLVSKSYIIR